LRNRRSKDDTSAERVAISDTGPGKPYSKTPEGSTRAPVSTAGADVDRPGWPGCANTCFAGIGIGAVAAGVVDTVVVVVDIVFISGFRSEAERELYMLAVMAAPAPALAAAIIAIVVFDMMNKIPWLPLGAALEDRTFI
jgi:hypothetical protein